MNGVEFFQRALFFLWCLISIISLVQTLDEYRADAKDQS